MEATHNPSCNPVLVESYRGEVLESFHRGVICVVDREGRIVYEEGDVQQVCYPRSALKFFQQLPLLLSGAADHFGFTDEEIAIMCGSHNGEQEHLRVVKSILAKIGMNESQLLCGAQAPTLKQDYYALIRAGEAPRALHNNCSGKHAGFLAWCVYNQADTDTYLQGDHPLHTEIRRWVSAFYELPETALQTGIDGCSAPIFAMPVINQAVAYRNLAAPEKFEPAVQEACARIRRAVSHYPLMIAGSKRYCTDLMRVAGSKIVGKTGADGVYCIGIPDRGLGIAIKIDDGKMGPQYHVAQQLLHNSGLLSEAEAEELASYLRTEQKNFAGRTTGWLRVNPNVRCRI
jgi:L-asparaginase II